MVIRQVPQFLRPAGRFAPLRSYRFTGHRSSIGTANERSAEKRTDIADESKKPAASNRAARPRGCEPVVYILLATTM